MAKKKNLTAPSVTLEEKTEYFVPINPPEPIPAVDYYFSQSELDPNARWVSERLNDLLYKVHKKAFTPNEINKLRSQLENSVSIK